MFRVRTYYKDILAIRDALRLADEDEEIDLANVIDTVDLHGHLERLKAKFPNTPAFRNKYQKIVTTLDLLSDPERNWIGSTHRRFSTRSESIFYWRQIESASIRQAPGKIC